MTKERRLGRYDEGQVDCGIIKKTKEHDKIKKSLRRISVMRNYQNPVVKIYNFCDQQDIITSSADDNVIGASSDWTWN